MLALIPLPYRIGGLALILALFSAFLYHKGYAAAELKGNAALTLAESRHKAALSLAMEKAQQDANAQAALDNQASLAYAEHIKAVSDKADSLAKKLALALKKSPKKPAACDDEAEVHQGLNEIINATRRAQ